MRAAAARCVACGLVRVQGVHLDVFRACFHGRYFIVWMRPRDQHLSDYLKVDIKGFDLAMEKALAEDPVI